MLACRLSVTPEVGCPARNVNARRCRASCLGQRNILLLVTGNDIEAAGFPFLLGLFDPLLGGGYEIPPDVALRTERRTPKQHEMRAGLRRNDDLVARLEDKQAFLGKNIARNRDLAFQRIDCAL